MIPEIEMYCHKCEDTMDWELEDEKEEWRIWECKGCSDSWLERR